MKKFLKIFLILFIFICGISIIFYMKSEKEELEVLDKDVSLSNIKSILEIENETSESEIQVPLGCRDNKIYILKYNSENQKYDNKIYAINEDSTMESTDITIPDKYIYNNYMNIYGEKIFNNCGYFDWSTGTETELVSNIDEGSGNNRCYSISGNSDFVLLKNNDEYTLCDIKNNETYSYKCTDNSQNIKSIAFNKNEEVFYVLDQSNCMEKVILDTKNFRLEKYKDLSIKEDLNINDYFLCSDNYLYLGSGILNDEINLNDEQKRFNIDKYNIDDNSVEEINNITICGYDKYYKDYVLVEKNDKDNSKTYLGKLSNDKFDLLMQIERSYNSDSRFSIHMFDAQNVLIKETYHDKESKSIKTKYSVYDLTDYFTRNKYVLNKDGTWSSTENNNLVLNNTLRKINDSENKVDVPSEKEEKIEDKRKEEIILPQKNEEKTNIKYVKQDNSKDYIGKGYGWLFDGGNWYYQNKNMENITGWSNVDGQWFYFDEKGAMSANCVIDMPEGSYSLGSDGALKKFIPKDSKELINTNNDSADLSSQKESIDSNLKNHEAIIITTNRTGIDNKKEPSIDEKNDKEKEIDKEKDKDIDKIDENEKDDNDE